MLLGIKVQEGVRICFDFIVDLQVFSGKSQEAGCVHGGPLNSFSTSPTCTHQSLILWTTSLPPSDLRSKRVSERHTTCFTIIFSLGNTLQWLVKQPNGLPAGICFEHAKDSSTLEVFFKQGDRSFKTQHGSGTPELLRLKWGVSMDSWIRPLRMNCPHQSDLVAPFPFLLPFLRELQSKSYTSGESTV